jgi:hypothetical protein
VNGRWSKSLSPTSRSTPRTPSTSLAAPTHERLEVIAGLHLHVDAAVSDFRVRHRREAVAIISTSSSSRSRRSLGPCRAAPPQQEVSLAGTPLIR